MRVVFLILMTIMLESIMGQNVKNVIFLEKVFMKDKELNLMVKRIHFTKNTNGSYDYFYDKSSFFDTIHMNKNTFVDYEDWTGDYETEMPSSDVKYRKLISVEPAVLEMLLQQYLDYSALYKNEYTHGRLFIVDTDKSATSPHLIKYYPAD